MVLLAGSIEEDTALEYAYPSEPSFGDKVDELINSIYSLTVPKDYDNSISDLDKMPYLEPSERSYENRLKELENIVYALQGPISYDAEIKRLEQLIVSGAFNPGDLEENLNIYTGLGANKITKELTFSNDSGALTLFTVTGDVWVNILPVITTDVLSAAVANVRLGVVGNTDAMIVDSVSTALLARAIWVDQTPDYDIETTERIRGYFIIDGNDVILTADAQVDSGAIRFYCFWSPLSTDGNVVVA